ncbi:MAG: cytoplasmic protein [Candidatus Marinimicrobia bacterium]|nr:cytoplasmic protein [Candidatus Neomarinimicrobiota bacterium]
MALQPLMPKATAVWLVENTTLSFSQIADFTAMHELEVQAIADGEVAIGIVGVNPISNGQLTQKELDRCQSDPKATLKISKSDMPIPKARSKGARYTPVSKRQERPDAIAWLLKNLPDLTDSQLCRLIGTTKPTINSVRDRTHWNSPNIKPQNPVILGLCTETELEKMALTASRRVERANKKAAKEAARKQKEKKQSMVKSDMQSVITESVAEDTPLGEETPS